MRSINKVIIIGNLTRDPVMKMTQSGQAVATFGVATNRQWVTRGSERHSSTEFHEVVAWAKLAEICEQYIRKGNLVYIEGYLKTRSWEGANEAEGKRYRTEVVIQDIIMLDKRHGGEEMPSVEGMDNESTQQNEGGWDEPAAEPSAPVRPTFRPSRDEPPLDELNLGLGEAISQDII